jgi:hypothetical protein
MLVISLLPSLPLEHMCLTMTTWGDWYYYTNFQSPYNQVLLVFMLLAEKGHI